MRGSNFDSRPPGLVSCVQNPCRLELETAIRIRPFMKKERGDMTLLETQRRSNEHGVQAVILNPLNPSLAQSPAGTSARGRSDSDSTIHNVPTEYHFNHILNESTTQDKMFNTLGLPIVHNTMKSLKTNTSNRTPNSHLLISIGVAKSGKSYTCFGGTSISKRRTADDGFVPRLFDSFFSQSAHAGAREFEIQISMVQVTQAPEGRSGDSGSCQIYDLLASQSSSSKTKKFGISPMKKKNLNVRNMAARFERVVPSPVSRKSHTATEDAIVLDAENLTPTVKSCRDASNAREILQKGLDSSQKQTTRDQKCHLYITMQPTVDGTNFGDKISILDMAGLEKEDTLHNPRGNESIAKNMDQTASANNAVLNCLRLLTHNSKLVDGKRKKSCGANDYDDECSEISSVSRDKFPNNEQLKPVPFRHNKITMILNPLFEQSSFVKVTLLLSAYPGHADFRQKRKLLNAVETLRGSTLFGDQGTKELNYETNYKIKSSADNRNEHHATYENNRVVNPTAPSEQVLSNSQQSYPPKGRKVVPITPVMAKVVQVRSARRSQSRTRPSVSIIPRAEPVKVSKKIDYTPGRMTERTPAHKSEDRHLFDHHAPVEHMIEQVSPTRLEVPQSSVESREMRESVTDFPGVEFSKTKVSESKRKHYAIGTKSHRNNANGIKVSVVGKEHEICSESRGYKPSFEKLEAQQSYVESKEMRASATDFPGAQFSQTKLRESERKQYTSATKLRRSNANGMKLSNVGKEHEMCSESRGYEPSFDKATVARKNFEMMSGDVELKSPLGRSRLENSEYFTPARTRIKQSEAKRTKNVENAENFSHSGDAQSNWFETDFVDFEKKIDNNKEDSTEKLETTLKEAIREKKTLEQICSNLERENAELKNAAREARRKSLQSRWVNQDQEEFLASRRLRHEAQNKVKYEIRQHLERVNYMYEIKNQCFMTNKTHFSLRFPDQFQRAPVLDIRDKNDENEGTEHFSFPKKETHLNDEDAVDSTGMAKVKSSLTASRLTPPIRSQPPAGLSALRKLIGSES